MSITRLFAAVILLAGSVWLFSVGRADFFLPWFFLAVGIGYLLARWWALVFCIFPYVGAVVIIQGPYFPIHELLGQGLLQVAPLLIMAILLNVALPGFWGLAFGVFLARRRQLTG